MMWTLLFVRRMFDPFVQGLLPQTVVSAVLHVII